MDTNPDWLAAEHLTGVSFCFSGFSWRKILMLANLFALDDNHGGGV